MKAKASTDRDPLPDGPACPLCGGAGFRPWRLGLLHCVNCGLIVSPAIWESGSNQQLSDAWFGEVSAGGVRSFWVTWFESRTNRRTIRRLATAGVSGCRLLEIGVGTGSFLSAAHAQGYDVMGCDLSPAICQDVTARLHLPMHCGPVASLDGPKRFDVIVMNHVLEHVQDPRAFLQAVVHLLAPAGVMHLAVPNLACWEARLPGWTSYEPYHLAYFTPHTLRKLLNTSQLSVAALTTPDSFSGWFLAILRTLIGVNRRGGAVARPAVCRAPTSGRERAPAVEHAYRLAMVISGATTWPLRWFQSRGGHGDEIVCVARNCTKKDRTH